MQQNAFGFNLLIDTGLDLSSTQSLYVHVKKPSGAVLERDLTTLNIVSVPNGQIACPIIQGDLNEIGLYAIQVFDNTTGRLLPSIMGSFYVDQNI